MLFKPYMRQTICVLFLNSECFEEKILCSGIRFNFECSLRNHKKSKKPKVFELRLQMHYSLSIWIRIRNHFATRQLLIWSENLTASWVLFLSGIRYLKFFWHTWRKGKGQASQHTTPCDPISNVVITSPISYHNSFSLTKDTKRSLTVDTLSLKLFRKEKPVGWLEFYYVLQWETNTHLPSTVKRG